jgi:hypothetical protein
VLRTGFILLLLFAGAAQAADSVYSQTVRDCSVSLEYHPQWASLRLRAQHPAFRPCALTAAETEAFLSAALPALPANAAFSSLGLGRLIDYQWISALLAEAAAGDPAWSGVSGMPVEGKTHVYVQRILSDAKIMDLFARAFGPYGYQITGVNVEKVLISAPNVRGVPDWVTTTAKVPFDAICYIRLKKPVPLTLQP